MNKFRFKSLLGKMTGLLLFGLIIAILLFSLLYFTGNTLLKSYFSTSSFRQNATKHNIEDLQTYATKNHISATDTDKLREWADQKHIGYFTISRERMLLYDNSYTGTLPLEQTESVQLHHTWQYFETVTFADGDADVFIYENIETKYYIIVNTIAAIISVLAWIGIFVIGVRHEVSYIKQLKDEVADMENGTMENGFSAKGSDELTDLANGLERMRLTLIEKEENEENMKTAQNKLVMGMAHDLRTPLTSLMTYLEIIKRQKSIDDASQYIEKTMGKAIQIKNLSDQLFEFFLLNSTHLPEMDTADNVEFLLGDYFSELYNLLENDGFTIDISNLLWNEIKIQTCYDYIGRIMNNILSNIMKYAEKHIPIQICSKYTKKEFAISIQNGVSNLTEEVFGTGIGVNNISIMMNQMNGRCEVISDDKTYTITLCFPYSTD